MRQDGGSLPRRRWATKASRNSAPKANQIHLKRVPTLEEPGKKKSMPVEHSVMNANTARTTRITVSALPPKSLDFPGP